MGGRVRTRTRVSTSPADPKLARDAPGGSGVLEFGGGVGVSGARSSGDLAGGPQRVTRYPHCTCCSRGNCGSFVDTLCVCGGVLSEMRGVTHRNFLRSLVSVSGVLYYGPVRVTVAISQHTRGSGGVAASHSILSAVSPRRARGRARAAAARARPASVSGERTVQTEKKAKFN